MSQENIELVRLAYDVVWKGRSADGVEHRFADDFTWRQRPEWPGRSAYTRDEMPELWADLDDTYLEFELFPVEFSEAADYVVVTVNTSAHLRASDARIEGTLWHVWRVVEGVLAEAQAYSSRREALEAAGIRD
jgi:ketosteroid isomerase-like protein